MSINDPQVQAMKMSMKVPKKMENENYRGSLGALFVTLTLLFVTTGCSSIDNSDMDNRLIEIKSRQAKKIPPLPVFKPYETFQYSAIIEQDPFKLFDGAAIVNSEHEIKVNSPIARNPEALEQYPLDTLRYVGQLIADGKEWAIVTSPDFIVHRVKIGNYLGHNYGQITAIQEDKISITEKISDDYRGWIERDAALSLSE